MSAPPSSGRKIRTEPSITTNILSGSSPSAKTSSSAAETRR
jgi:hypothetical protein